MKYRVVALDPSEVSDKRWQEYHELLLELKRRYKSSYRSATWEDLKRRITSHLAEDEHFHPAMVFEADRLVGWADFTARNVGTSNQVVWPLYDLLPRHVPDAMIEALARWAVDYMRRYDAEDMYHMAWDARYWDIDKRWRGEQFSCSQEYVLYRDRADHATISGWVAATARANPRLSIAFRDEIPDDLIDSYVELLLEGSHDIPEESDSGLPIHTDAQEIQRQERWCRANGVLSLHCFLHDDCSNLIAFTQSMTNLRLPEFVDQFMTTVRRTYRGRGWAKWLKGAMFLELERRLPKFERVVTWMRAINEPILHINAQMGFVPEREAREFRISRESIERYLGRNS